MFPGAVADRDVADYVVVGAPLDASTTFQPGARFGPRRVRHFVEPFDDFDHRTSTEFTDLAVHDHGDVRAWDDTAEYLSVLEGVLGDAHDDGAVPLVLGGEHTVTVAGVRAADPDTFVCLDAHLDLREAYNGNPLSHATVVHHALGVTERIVLLGARTGNEAEWERTNRDDVEVVPPEGVADWTPDFGPNETVYLSVDVDVVDPGFAPGTGTMEPFGLSPREVRDVVRVVAPSASAFDVVEVNDRDDGQAAALAGKVLREFVYSHAAGSR